MKETSILSQTLVEEGIHYRIMESSDLQAAAECFARSFQREPMVRQLGIQKEEFIPFALVCCQQAIEQGMGLVAIDESTNEIAGFTILQDALDEIQFDITAHQNFLPIFEMLGQLQSKYIADKKITAYGEVVVSFVTGVHPEYQGTKVAFLLFGQSLELAKAKDYKKMITEVTGRLSQNGVRRRYAFTPYASILYREFLFDGQAIFGNIEDQSLSCVLMEKSLLN
jgi:GNAT superfamily N-acetyltransferase